MTASWMSNEEHKSFNIAIKKCQFTVQFSLKEEEEENAIQLLN